MASYCQTSGRYPYGLGTSGERMGEGEGEEDRSGFTGILDIYVHHARNIHNICIYDNQDVYAKFSLTYNPDEALATKIVKCGGKNPEFNENLQIKITQEDAVLKCEMWMLSRARNYLEDQLLGFALVPLSSVAGKGKLAQDFALSSTDLFHSPAGTVRLTLMYQGSASSECQGKSFSGSNLALSPSSISSEVVLLDRSAEDFADYNSIEFPDMEVARENQQLVSEYFKMASTGMKADDDSKIDYMVADQNDFSGAPFLHLGTTPSAEDDYEMSLNTAEEKHEDPHQLAKESHMPAYQNTHDAENSSHTGILSSTTTSLSEDQNSHDFGEHKSISAGESCHSHISSPARTQTAENSPETPSSANDNVSGDRHETSSSKEEDKDKEGSGSSSETRMTEGESDISFTKPLISINIEPEETVVQQQIVDMYMKSMQQFTESLAKMKLPMDLENKGSDDATDTRSKQNKLDAAKKDGSRVFYGSRAFF